MPAIKKTYRVNQSKAITGLCGLSRNVVFHDRENEPVV